MALALVRVAKLTASLDIKRTASEYKSNQKTSKISEVQSKIGEIVSASSNKKELMRTLGDVMEKEITKSVEMVEMAVAHKYEGILEEKGS
ncbi:MAG: hypothetical protein P9L90_03680 [Candidatus Aadella gelida]|nr:hypothetical protein [Candidatus Aadella gelida]